MNALSYLIIAFLLASTYLSLSNPNRAKGLQDFATAGGTISSLLCALSLVSTIIGGSATLGMGAFAQKVGEAAFWWLGVGAIGLIVHGWAVAPLIRKMPAMTLPEVAAVRVGEKAKLWSAVIIGVSWVAVTAAQFVALWALLNSLMSASIATFFYGAIALAVILHTAMGGQRAVIKTDALQAVLLLGGFIAAALWCVNFAPVNNISWVPFNENFAFLDWVTLMLLVGITYIVGPDMFSRSFAARDARSARRATWIASPLLVVFGVSITYMALANIEANSPIAEWLSEGSSMPWLLKAILALGLISALCGTVDTVLLSAATIAERDIFGKNRLPAVRLLVIFIGLMCALVVFVSADIIRLLLIAYSFFVPGVAAPLLVTLLMKKYRFIERYWMFAAVSGGLLGLSANLTGIQNLAILGVFVSVSGAVLSVRIRAPLSKSTDCAQ